jgi:hypothetical protein
MSWVVMRCPPVGVPGFPFYRPRERPGIHKRKRKGGKEEREKQGRRKLWGCIGLLL